MSLGLIGRKVGMTRVFTEDGESIPVTVLEVVPNRVTQIKTLQSDGYTGLQVAHGERRASRDRVGPGRLLDDGPEALCLAVQQARRTRQLLGFQGIATDQLGQEVGLMRRGAGGRSHLEETHRHTPLGCLPGRLCTREATTHDGHTCLGLHGSDYAVGLR